MTSPYTHRTPNAMMALAALDFDSLEIAWFYHCSGLACHAAASTKNLLKKVLGCDGKLRRVV
jgi:hypothetical protein